VEPLPYVPVEAGAIGTSPASGSGDRLRILRTEKNFPRLEPRGLFLPAIDALSVVSHVRILSEIIDALPRAGSPPSMVTDRFGSVGRYAMAVVAIAGATLLHSLLFSVLGARAHFIIYFPAIVFAAWVGGLGPGLLSTALACLLVWYAFTAPRFSFALADPAAPAQLWIFLFFGALTCVLAEGMRRARRRAEIEHASQRAQAAKLEDAYHYASKRQREAESLASIVQTINTLDLDAALRHIAENACTLLEADVAAVFGLDVTVDRLILRARGGPRGSDLDPNVSLPRGTGLVWLAVDQREAIVSHNILEDTRIRHTPEMRARIEAAPHRAGLAIPLVVQGHVTGALFVGALLGRAFSPDDIKLVTAYAHHAAIAMANAELYQEAQRANRTKDEFLAMFGHELRNPLGAIANASAVLQNPKTQEATGQRARAVIDRQVEHLSRLVEDLLDVGRLTTGKVRLHRRPLDLGALVTAVMDEWRTAGRFARHQVDLDIGTVWVEADETRGQQILENLVGNALKYTPAGGRVTIRVAEEDGQAVLEISDTGAGLPSALLGRIFDLFVQGERALDRAQGGLGIGLTIVKALVVLHGGTVTVRSEGPGHGSVFTVHLPSSSRPGEARRPALPSAPASARRRILIIEDNEDARVMLRTQLALDGHDIHEAADGYAGIDKATAVVPDVVLVDVGLPGLDGYEVARRIRAERNGQAVRLVAITGYGQPEDRSRALEAGFDVHLTKPVSPEQLAEVLAESVRTQSTEVTRGDAIVPEPSV